MLRMRASGSAWALSPVPARRSAARTGGNRARATRAHAATARATSIESVNAIDSSETGARPAQRSAHRSVHTRAHAHASRATSGTASMRSREASHDVQFADRRPSWVAAPGRRRSWSLGHWRTHLATALTCFDHALRRRVDCASDGGGHGSASRPDTRHGASGCRTAQRACLVHERAAPPHSLASTCIHCTTAPAATVHSCARSVCWPPVKANAREQTHRGRHQRDGGARGPAQALLPALLQQLR